MNTLTFEKRCAVVRCLCDGCSVRATARITGVSFNSIQKLTIALGQAALEFQNHALRNLPCKRLEVDEIWCFAYCKDKNVPAEMRGEPGIGSIWTWTAIDADTKLIASWRLGARDAANAHYFISDLAERLANRVQLTTDGNRLYLAAVDNGFRGNVDYGMLVKQFGNEQPSPENRYSPGKCLGATKHQIEGEPDMALCSTAFAERQNLNIRMQNRRYTRLTNAFSKKAEMLAYSVAISMLYHNFVRVHQTLKTTPAVAAGIAKHKWKVEDMVNLLPLDVAGKRGPYKKKISN